MLVTKYRPKSFDEIIGRDNIVKDLKNLCNDKDGIPHLLFFGPPGTGKTLTAEVIANTVFGENKSDSFFEFNASSERGIDFVRDRIIEIAKRKPLHSEYKIILMDEADSITPEAQACFRRIIEQYSSVTRFIFTCNYPYKIISPLLSRFKHFEFSALDVKTIGNYIKKIAIKEGKTIDDSLLIQIAKKSNGDIRSALNILEGDVKEVNNFWETMTYEKLKKMPENERVELAFKDEPDNVFNGIFEFVKREKLWDFLSILADTNHKMNYSVHKTLFLCALLQKMK